jgi:rhodanese-related sulfurtransferase
VIKKSGRLKTITLKIIKNGRPQNIKIRFDRKPRGIDHAVSGKQVIISCRISKDKVYAKSIRPDIDGLAPGVTEISPKTVRSLLRSGDNFLLIDARSHASFQQAHLPTAVSIPSCEVEKTNLLPEEKDTLLIFYCGGPLCGMSTAASASATRRGYTNVKVMRKGMTGWQDAGFAAVADDDYVLTGRSILIDLRPASRDTVNRIPGSVSIPYNIFEKRLQTIPRKAPVVVYSDNIQQTLTALSLLHDKGFPTPSMVNGNFQGWLKRKKTVTSGPVVTEIKWQRKRGEHEVPVETFTQTVMHNNGVLIVDVRTPEETRAGRIRGAVRLPLNELFERMNELPKKKKIYLYSATGARAEMAARLLRENGYRVWYLDADITCSGGKCTIVK